MTSVLRQLQAEWNTLVPMAQARRVPRVRMLNAPLETIAYRRAKLEWLKAQLNLTGSVATLAAASDLDAFSFGAELEFILPYGQSAATLAAAITAAGVPCHSSIYTHTTSSTWKIVTDGSVRGRRGSGLELVSPVLRGEAGIESLRTVCRVLTASGCKINKTCGFHVHVGATDKPVSFFKNLVKLYASAQSTIDTFLAPSRRGYTNGYCRPLAMTPDREARIDRALTIADVSAAIGQMGTDRASARGPNRYSKLNLQAFWQHGTVEFRHHQGTVDADKAVYWVRFVLRLCLAATKGEKKPASFDELMAAVEVPAHEQNFFRGRVTYFNRPQRRAA